ncbi:hypothetical protein TRAPUB_8523 [Trametes pubescens]|uniref:Uncharacterized protein n=1 Tax=Trametes pubescens TaxID=154538 RepID=A0A1M2W4Y8_TRAPU|nr:hypothetical protein TRAPUB_8523 [Trametes pubescens]
MTPLALDGAPSFMRHLGWVGDLLGGEFGRDSELVRACTGLTGRLSLFYAYGAAKLDFIGSSESGPAV